MALVPFRVSGAAADQTLEHRIFQIGQHTIRIDQDVHKSGSLQRVGIQPSSQDPSPDFEGEEHLEHVGLVVWQSAFVLAEYLLRHPPFGQWDDVHAVDLGAGTGVCGIALSMAGAQVILSDVGHITPLTVHNLKVNCGDHQRHSKVVVHCWGQDVKDLMPSPDVITGADVVYQQEHFDALITTLQDLAAAHTLIYLAFKIRGRGEQSFKKKLESSNFAVQQVPFQHLHEEYADGQYEVIRACKLGS
ncbi:hypothetical protein WJX77_003568 [Trebouxia sp. C0004]